jgi:hypothetical protein
MQKFFIFVFAAVLLMTVKYSQAQQNTADTIPVNEVSFKKKNPKLAGSLSALVPGAGQFYNESYFKIPIIYGSFTSLLFFAKQNNDLYQEFLLRYSAYGLPGPTYFYTKNIPQATLERYKEYYRRNRDLLYIGVGFTYLLNILDAVVDAHLSYFDIGDANQFALKIQPDIYTNKFNAKPVYGLSFAINLK